MTIREVADELMSAKARAQAVLEDWPTDAGSFAQVEQAVELLGSAVDSLDATLEEMEEWDW